MKKAIGLGMGLAVVIGAGGIAGDTASAAGVEEFYKGRQMKMIIRFRVMLKTCYHEKGQRFF